MNTNHGSLTGFVKDEEGRIIHSAADGLILDPRILRSGRDEVHIFTLPLGRDQLTPVTGVVGVVGGAAQVICRLKVLDDCIVCNMEVDSTVQMVDDANGNPVELDCSDSDDVTLSKDPEVGEVLPDQRGRYDLEPTALALFYSSVPTRISTAAEREEMYREHDDVISEDEYQKRVQRGDYSDNPFKKLKM
ncbi:MAG TPA: hypothetical protein DEA32_00850 [Firmicutes bacterium]|nr:hypothetical protein [Bacillota bacterium]